MFAVDTRPKEGNGGNTTNSKSNGNIIGVLLRVDVIVKPRVLLRVAATSRRNSESYPGMHTENNEDGCTWVCMQHNHVPRYPGTRGYPVPGYPGYLSDF
eukprot:1305966-Rhodomonas_salina.1